MIFHKVLRGFDTLIETQAHVKTQPVFAIKHHKGPSITCKWIACNRFRIKLFQITTFHTSDWRRSSNKASGCAIVWSCFLHDRIRTTSNDFSIFLNKKIYSSLLQKASHAKMKMLDYVATWWWDFWCSESTSLTKILHTNATKLSTIIVLSVRRRNSEL